jgi:hypothetical protein
MGARTSDDLVGAADGVGFDVLLALLGLRHGRGGARVWRGGTLGGGCGEERGEGNGEVTEKALFCSVKERGTSDGERRRTALSLTVAPRPQTPKQAAASGQDTRFIHHIYQKSYPHIYACDLNFFLESELTQY